MAYKKSILILAFLFGFQILTNSMCHAAIYYIDFDGGNDSSAGTSEGTAWKTIPGTKTTGSSASSASGWVSTSWGSGTINSSNKVQAGDVFRIKPGTQNTYGQIWIGTTYYASNAAASNPIKFVAYQAWNGASGTVTFDGSGVSSATHYGLIHNQWLPGIEFDGEVAAGFTMRDAYRHGLVFSADDPNSPQDYPLHDGAVVKYFKFIDCNQVFTSGTNNQRAVIEVEYHKNVLIDNVEIDGGDYYAMGIFFAGERRTVTATVSNTKIYDLMPADSMDSSGVGILAHNSNLTVDNCEIHDVNKGVDFGEQKGNNYSHTYTIKNSKFYNNAWGSNLNSAGDTYSGTIKYYIFNNLYYDNRHRGIDLYSNPYTAYIVHNTFDNNGYGSSNVQYANIGLTPDNDQSKDTIYLYNNIFYKPGGGSNLLNERYWDDDDVFDLHSDYNSWVQRSSENFATFAYFITDCQYSYGANGPGQTSGDWYDEKGCDTTASSKGHQGSDANSKTADDIPFKDVAGYDYTLITSYPGTNLTRMPWYIPEMGFDRNGVDRVSWDLGAYESGAKGFIMGAPKNLRIIITD